MKLQQKFQLVDLVPRLSEYYGTVGSWSGLRGLDGWLRIGTVVGHCVYGKEPSGSIKMWGITWLAAKNG
jgi:hypothetical protein